MRRWLAVLCVLALSSVLAASCRNVLGLEGHASAVSELCALVERCYGPQLLSDCEARLGGQLEAAGSDTRAGWLRDFGNRACLESCTNAWFCLDTVPVCGGTGDSCATAAGCCGFSDAQGDCSPAGSCCISKGHTCQDSAECCVGECRDGLCGGQQCAPQGAMCELPSDCCSSVCVNGMCEDKACLPGGADCFDPSDCCSQECLFGALAEEGIGVCAEQGCLLDLSPCAPGTGLDCCEGQCVFAPAYGGYTCVAGCWPVGTACDDDGGEACCSNKCEMGACSPFDTGGDNTGGGSGAPACKSQGEDCTTAGECCAQQCYSGECCQDQRGTAGCGEDVCTVSNIPWSPQCGCGLPGCANDTTCVAKVCAADPFCCCDHWDELCVNQAQLNCNIVCPVMTGRQQPQ